MSWIKTISLSIIPILIGFLTFEIGIRIIKGTKLHANKVQYSHYSKIYSDERDQPYLFWHKPNVNVKLSDGYYDFVFKTNKLGHRSLSDKISFDKSIVFIGDSIIEGASVENNETLPYVVSKNINIPSINLGLGSSNTVHQYLISEEKIRTEFNMEILVLGFCLNDISQNLYRRSFEPQIGNWKYFDSVEVDDQLLSHKFSKGTAPPKSLLQYIKPILKKSETILFFNRIVEGGLGLSLQTSKLKYSAEAWKNTEYFIRKLNNLSKNQNAEFVVIIFPYQDQIEGKFDFNVQIKLKQLLEKNQIKYFDPSDILLKNKNSIQDASNLYHDNVHPNKLGTLLIANAFSNYLVDNFFYIKD